MRFYSIVFFFFSITAFCQTKSFQVGFLLDKNSPEISVLLNELTDEIIAVVGEDAKLEFPPESTLVNNFNAELALRNYNSLVQNETDIIIAFGVVNNSVISVIGSYNKPTIVFGALSKELITDNTLVSSIKNYTSIITSQSYTDDLKVLKQLAKPTNVGVIIEKAFIENLPIEETFSDIGQELDIEIRLIPFENFNDITSNLEEIDAIYMAGGFYLSDDEIKSLAEILIEKKLPSFTANSLDDVKKGIMASNHDQSNLNQFFRRIALTVESAVNEEDLSKLSTNLESISSLTINYNTAERIGLPLKYSLIATTNFVGNTKERVADKTYNLVSLMQDAIAENLELKSFEQDVFLTEKDVQLAKSEYLPNMTANASGNYIDPKLAEVSNGQNPELSTRGNISLSQTVFSESANASISIQKSISAAQKENYKSDALNAIYNTATAYFTALILKSNLFIQKQNLELTKSNLNVATENYEAGQSSKSDVLRFRSELAQNTQQLVEAINQLEKGYIVINQLLNNPIETKIDVDEAELNSDIFSDYKYVQLGQFLDDPQLRKPFVKFLVQEAISNAPEIKALDYNLEATERSQRLYGAGRFLPTLALQGQYNYEFTRSGVGTEYAFGFPALPDGYYTVGLNVSLPIFNQNKQNLNQQIATIQKERLEITIDNVKLNIEKNINDSVLELINQISNIQLSKIFEDTAQEALDLTQTSYANGAVNIVQLLDAQNNYLQAQLASANATYNYLQSTMQLERSLGLFFLLQDKSERDAFEQRFLEFITNND